MVVFSSNGSAATSRHSRESVLDAAMDLLDEYGLPELSMRRIAKTLELQPSALYWHFPNKQRLLAALSLRIVTRSARTPPLSHHEASELRPELIVDHFRNDLLTHRDGAELVSSSFALGLVELPIIATLRAALLENQIAPAMANTAAITLTHFVLGYVFHEQQRTQADSWGTTAPQIALVPEAAAPSGHAESKPLTDSETIQFQDGVELILHGLATQTLHSSS